MNAILSRLTLAALVVCFGASCTTAYDAYGRPQQVVDPATAVVGAAAVGLLAYGLANSNDHRHYDRHHSSRSYYRAPSYRRGYYDGCSY